MSAAYGTLTPSSVSWLTSITTACGAPMLARTIGTSGAASWNGRLKDAERCRRAATSFLCEQCDGHWINRSCEMALAAGHYRFFDRLRLRPYQLQWQAPG